MTGRGRRWPTVLSSPPGVDGDVWRAMLPAERWAWLRRATGELPPAQPMPPPPFVVAVLAWNPTDQPMAQRVASHAEGLDALRLWALANGYELWSDPRRSEPGCAAYLLTHEGRANRQAVVRRTA